MIIATVKGIAVNQDPDTWRIWWTSGMAVDADGANGQKGGPFAYRYPDDNGLDRLSDAGWPMYQWTNVLYDSGHRTPLTDGSGNAFSKTTYTWKGTDVAHRSVDSWSVPYVVVNPHVRLNSCGVVIGCKAKVSYQGRFMDAVVADVSGAGDIGEGSIALAKALGIDDNALTGGVPHGVFFELFPGTAADINGVTYELQRA